MRTSAIDRTPCRSLRTSFIEDPNDNNDKHVTLDCVWSGMQRGKNLGSLDLVAHWIWSHLITFLHFYNSNEYIWRLEPVNRPIKWLNYLAGFPLFMPACLDPTCNNVVTFIKQSLHIWFWFYCSQCPVSSCGLSTDVISYIKRMFIII